jgi:acyl-CoA thioesterase
LKKPFLSMQKARDMCESSKNIGLSDIISSLTDDGQNLRSPLPASWLQGRTAFGGLSSALVLSSALQQHRDAGLPPLRSALVNFTAPVNGSPQFTSQILRQGRNITTITSDARQDDKVLCRATFTFGNPIANGTSTDKTAPSAPSPEDLPAAPKLMTAGPSFLQNFDIRPIAGSAPFSGAEHGYLRAWVRHRNTADQTGVVPLLCLADVLPPAAMTMLKTPAMNSSVTWLFNLLDAHAVTQEGWYMVETELTAASEGYSSQVMRIWTTQGKLVSDGMQSVVLFS